MEDKLDGWDYEGCRRLAIAIIAQAAYDAGSKNTELRAEAFEWLRGEDAKNLADLCGIQLQQDYYSLSRASKRAGALVAERNKAAIRAYKSRLKKKKESKVK